MMAAVNKNHLQLKVKTSKDVGVYTTKANMYKLISVYDIGRSM